MSRLFQFDLLASIGTITRGKQTLLKKKVRDSHIHTLRQRSKEIKFCQLEAVHNSTVILKKTVTTDLQSRL